MDSTGREAGFGDMNGGLTSDRGRTETARAVLGKASGKAPAVSPVWPALGYELLSTEADASPSPVPRPGDDDRFVQEIRLVQVFHHRYRRAWKRRSRAL